jgi:hypothetical protein
MAAESDEPKGGDDEARRSGRDRRRPPLTIDLTADAARGKSASASSGSPRPDSGAGAPGAAGPSSGAGSTTSRPLLGGVTWPTFDRDRLVGFGSAAALGGVVALLLLMLLQAAGVLPAPGASIARLAADQAHNASDALASVERRLTAVEAMTEGVPAQRTEITATVTRVAALEKGAGAAAAKSDLETVRTDLASLRSRVDQTAPSATPGEVAAVTGRLQRVEAALAAGPSAAGAAAAAIVPPADADARIAGLSQRLDAAEAAIKGLSSTSTAAAGANAASARTTARAALRRVVDAGKPFSAELDGLAAFGPDPAVTSLRPYAQNGIATREGLHSDFGKVEDAILVATQGTDDSIFGRLVAGARSLVSVRPSAPIAGNDPTAIVSRMDAAVAGGDLSTALRERDGLPAAGKTASAEWAARAGARVAADAVFGDPAATGTINR